MPDKSVLQSTTPDVKQVLEGLLNYLNRIAEGLFAPLRSEEAQRVCRRIVEIAKGVEDTNRMLNPPPIAPLRIVGPESDPTDPDPDRELN